MDHWRLDSIFSDDITNKMMRIENAYTDIAISIRNCDIYVFFLNRSFLTCKSKIKEVYLAESCGKIIIPVILDPELMKLDRGKLSRTMQGLKYAIASLDWVFPRDGNSHKMDMATDIYNIILSRQFNIR